MNSISTRNELYETDLMNNKLNKKSEIFKDSINKLEKLGLYFEVKSQYHIKFYQQGCRSVNFYPTSGACNFDGAKKFKRSGFNFLIEVLKSEGYFLKE